MIGERKCQRVHRQNSSFQLFTITCQILHYLQSFLNHFILCTNNVIPASQVSLIWMVIPLHSLSIHVYVCASLLSLFVKVQAFSFENACCATNGTSQDIQVCCRHAFGILLCTIFTKLRCPENRTQDHNRSGDGVLLHSHASKDKTWSKDLFVLLNL